MKKALFQLFVIVGAAGCASTQYVEPKGVGLSTVEFAAAYHSAQPGGVQVLAFKPPGCNKHPGGVFVGVICRAAGCPALNDARFESGEPLTLKFEFKSGDITTRFTEHCNGQLTFVPAALTRYRASFAVSEEACATRLEKKNADGTWSKDESTTYAKQNQQACIWW